VNLQVKLESGRPEQRLLYCPREVTKQEQKATKGQSTRGHSSQLSEGSTDRNRLGLGRKAGSHPQCLLISHQSPAWHMTPGELPPPGGMPEHQWPPHSPSAPATIGQSVQTDRGSDSGPSIRACPTGAIRAPVSRSLSVLPPSPLLFFETYNFIYLKFFHIMLNTEPLQE
jgi:hypothetical protein